MRSLTFIVVALLGTARQLPAQSADDLIARSMKAAGGNRSIAAATTVRRTGKYITGNGVERDMVQENTRGGKVRREFTEQGMTVVNAYDDTVGWKIDPFAGKKDAESSSGKELHGNLAAAPVRATSLSAAVSAATRRTLPRLHVSGNGRYLVRDDGTPFLYIADTGWELFHRLDRKQAREYLALRAKQRFSVVQAVALGGTEKSTRMNVLGGGARRDRQRPRRQNGRTHARAPGGGISKGRGG